MIKRQFGYVKVRFRGLMKNTAQLTTLFALSNLWMARKQLVPSGEYPGIQSIPLPRINAVCVIPVGNVLASKEVVTLDDLHERRLISLSTNNPLQRRITLAMEARGIVSLSSVETTAAHSACGMVSGGLVLTVCDPFTTSYSKYPGITLKKLEKNILFEISMVFPSHQQRPKLASNFIQIME